MGKFMGSPYQGLECKTLSQNLYSRVISALDCNLLSPLFPLAHLCVFSHQPLSSNRFQTSHGLLAYLLNAKPQNKEDRKKPD